MIEIGTRMVCREFGHKVTVTGIDGDFVDYEGVSAEGSIRADIIEDFYDLDDKNETDGTNP